MTTLREFAEQVHTLWPLDTAEPWDAPGVLAGRGDWPVKRVLVAVDAVRDTVDEAVSGDYDLLLTHHPLLMRGVTSIADDRAKGDLLTRLIESRIGLIAAHTNADIAASGATQVLADLLGLAAVVPIVPSTVPTVGLGRVGELPSALSLGDLAKRLSELLPATAGGVRGAGDWHAPVRRVALCSGAGDSLLDAKAVRTADVYITSDLRHHPAQEAIELARVAGGPALLDVSHWASEWLWCDAAATELRALCPDVTVEVSELRTDPWDFAVLPAERNA